MDFSSEKLIESTDVDLPSQETPVTYDGLLDRGAAQLQSSQKRQSIANMCSALRGWMRAHGFVGGRLVQDDFEAGFDRLMLRFDAYLKQTVGPRTRRDRQEQLVQWRQVFNALRNVDTLPRGFREALAVIMSARCVNIATLAANVNMPPNTLGNWLSGKVTPRGKSIAHVSALERQLDVPSGTLLNRLPAGRRGSHLSRTAGVVLETTYTKRRRAQIAQVREYRLPFAGSIAEEWEALLRHKTDPATAEDEDETRKRRGTWRLKSIESQAQRVEPWMLLDYSVCATAGVHWGIFASYLGWLRLPRPQGAGVKPDQAGTLAWLLDSERVKAHARWLKARSGGILHNGIKVFIDTVCSYLRPRTGFLWVHSEVSGRLAESSDAPAAIRACCNDEPKWRQACEDARVALRRFLRTEMKAAKGVRRSRDPRERPAAVLNAAWPLLELVRLARRLEASAPPPAHHRDYRAWLRDVVMFRMFMSNPLRAETYSVMTYRRDNSGNLIRVAPGRYRLKFEPEDFKNQDGAANEPYEVDVHHSVGPWIERYLSEARPHMPYAGTSDRFLLPAVVGPKVRQRKHLEDRGLREVDGYSSGGPSSRLKVLTARYIDGCPGFGSQAFRHIVATNHLRRHPGTTCRWPISCTTSLRRSYRTTHIPVYRTASTRTARESMAQSRSLTVTQHRAR